MNSDSDATLMAGPIGRYLANVVRWASGTTGSAVRVAGPNGGSYTTTQGIANLNTSAVSALLRFRWPAGYSLPPSSRRHVQSGNAPATRVRAN